MGMLRTRTGQLPARRREDRPLPTRRARTLVRRARRRALAEGTRRKLLQQAQGQAAAQQQQPAGSQLQAQKLYLITLYWRPHRRHPAKQALTPRNGPRRSRRQAEWRCDGYAAKNVWRRCRADESAVLDRRAAVGMGAGGPYNALPMRLTGSDKAVSLRSRNRSPNIASWAFDFGFKKRACDQLQPLKSPLRLFRPLRCVPMAR